MPLSRTVFEIKLDVGRKSRISILLAFDTPAREQGRRHGFESGGQFCERSEPKKIFDPPLFGQWGRQNIA